MYDVGGLHSGLGCAHARSGAFQRGGTALPQGADGLSLFLGVTQVGPAKVSTLSFTGGECLGGRSAASADVAITNVVPARSGRRAHGVDATGPSATTMTSSAPGRPRGSRTRPWTASPLPRGLPKQQGRAVTTAACRARRRLATA